MNHRKKKLTHDNRFSGRSSSAYAAQEQLRASREIQEHLRLLIDVVQDYAIFMLDPEGNVASWNAGAERLKGYKASEIIGRHFSCFYPEEDMRLEKPQSELRLAAERGRLDDEGWRVRKDGSRFWANITITAVRDRSGKLLGFGKVTRDVTERMEAARWLRESESRYRTLVEAAADAIVFVDEEMRIAFVNPATTRIFQYSDTELMGGSLAILIPECPNGLQGDRSLDWAQREMIGLRKSGQKFPVEVSIVESVKGGARHFICSMHDLTGPKRIEQKLSESETALRRLSLHLFRSQDEERRRIGRDLHDSLGQSLVALKMNLDSLASLTPTGTEAGNVVAECQRGVESAIQELRTISYLMYPPMLDELGLQAAVAWYLEGFSQRSEIVTTLEVLPGFTRFSAGIELTMFRVLQESLTNVHRHSCSPTAQVRLSCVEGMAKMEVIDQGHGMPETTLEEAEQEGAQAFGVGLRSMEERVHELGGSFKVTSSSSGTAVTVTIPRK
jgi:PAS domain S-box-containing protein